MICMNRKFFGTVVVDRESVHISPSDEKTIITWIRLGYIHREHEIQWDIADVKEIDKSIY